MSVFLSILGGILLFWAANLVIYSYHEVVTTQIAWAQRGVALVLFIVSAFLL